MGTLRGSWEGPKKMGGQVVVGVAWTLRAARHKVAALMCHVQDQMDVLSRRGRAGSGAACGQAQSGRGPWGVAEFYSLLELALVFGSLKVHPASLV